MINHLPTDILEYLCSYLSESDCWCVSKSSIYFYTLMKNNLISNWMKRGLYKIDRVNIDKLSIKNENRLVDEYIFYSRILGFYFSKPVGDEHNHLFISLDTFISLSSEYKYFENAIAEDENGNIMRGVVQYETILR